MTMPQSIEPPRNSGNPADGPESRRLRVYATRRLVRANSTSKERLWSRQASHAWPDSSQNWAGSTIVNKALELWV
jgi:hypothetical protein